MSTGGGSQPLIQWHRGRHDCKPYTTDDAASNHHGVGPGTCCASLQSRANACHQHSREGSEPATQIVASRVREEDIADPGAEIVYGRNQTGMRGVGLVQCLDEARMDEDCRENSYIIAVRVRVRPVIPFSGGGGGWSANVGRCLPGRSAEIPCKQSRELSRNGA